jgi:hypothetical protein
MGAEDVVANKAYDFIPLSEAQLQMYMTSIMSVIRPQHIFDLVNKNEKFFTFASTVSPINTFTKLVSHPSFEIQDIVILMGVVLVFGRSLKQFEPKHKTEYAEKFREICTKYSIKTTYKKNSAEAARTTKVEHVFTAFPAMARLIQLRLLEMQKLQKPTEYTERGIDFQASSGLETWSNPTEFAIRVLIQERKNVRYIAIRSSGDTGGSEVITDPDDSSKKVTKKEYRIRQQYRARKYTIIGMTGVDPLVKGLWELGIMAPPCAPVGGHVGYDKTISTLNQMKLIKPSTSESDIRNIVADKGFSKSVKIRGYSDAGFSRATEQSRAKILEFAASMKDDANSWLKLHKAFVEYFNIKHEKILSKYLEEDVGSAQSKRGEKDIPVESGSKRKQ